MKKLYLGDGVYVELDRDRLLLTTQDGYGSSNYIFLEMEVFERLKIYVERLNEENAKRRSGGGDGKGLV
jgi:hypothetical protein